tara:strand:+ start:6015 stop:6263 length:249 start_codon:yes stop_codon:yes gene_type:complete
MSKIFRFGIVNKDVLTDPELSLTAKAVYSMLATYANKNRTCYPSVKTLADVGGCSCSTIDRAIKELKIKNYIIREGRKLYLI